MTTFYDRVKETTTTTGTGNVTLAGAVSGFQSFNSAVGVGPSFMYLLEQVDANNIPNGDWEVGWGYLSASTTLVRQRVQYSSNANALVSLASGTHIVAIVFPGQRARGSNRAFSFQYGLP